MAQGGIKHSIIYPKLSKIRNIFLTTNTVAYGCFRVKIPQTLAKHIVENTGRVYVMNKNLGGGHYVNSTRNLHRFRVPQVRFAFSEGNLENVRLLFISRGSETVRAAGF